MIFNSTPLKDAFTIDLEKRGDDRGFFARFFCVDEFSKAGLESRFVQVNNSLSTTRGTLRGMHYQLGDSAEVKIVRCIRGKVWDAIIDLRPDSPTYSKWFGAELSDENRRMMYVPRGFAHGILTLTDHAELLYLVSNFYAPSAERGIRWNDQAFAIDWPIRPTEISQKDGAWPDFNAEYHGIEAMRGLK